MQATTMTGLIAHGGESWACLRGTTLSKQEGYLMARAPGWEDRRTRNVPVGCTMSSASAVSRVTANPQMACGSVASHILPTCARDATSDLGSHPCILSSVLPDMLTQQTRGWLACTCCL